MMACAFRLKADLKPAYFFLVHMKDLKRRKSESQTT